MAGQGQRWQIAADGGYFANPKLSDELRYAAQPQMKFDQFVRDEPGMGKGVGDTIDFDKISNITPATNRSGLDESLVMPESKFKVKKGHLVVTEYGNSVPYTGKLEALSKWDPNNVIQKTLMQDQAKTLDALAASYFKRSGVWYVPRNDAAGGIFADPNGDGLPPNGGGGGSVNVQANVNISMADVIVARDYMSSVLLTPPYDGENYVFVGSTKAIRGVKGTISAATNSYWMEAHKYNDQENIMTGEVGMLEGIRFVETNAKDSLTSNMGASNICGEAVMFGADPVVRGPVIPPEVRAAIPADYGRSKGVAWYALLGWACPWTFTADSEARIIWFTSNDNPNKMATPPAGLGYVA
jgi:N4-gp56 family major capsid protein